ncbi:pentapeptide repeat-containing protein [Streptomyces stramineus]
MKPRTVRQTSVILPVLDDPGLRLATVPSLGASGRRGEEFTYADASLRELDLADAHLLDGRVLRLRTQRTTLKDLRVDSVEFSGCDLGSLRWSGGKLSRAVFSDCKLLGAAFDSVAFDSVLFENCKLDYATFRRARATGPVIFSKCSLAEASFARCDLSAACFDGCGMRRTEFEGGQYRGCDLRNNDLSAVRGLLRCARS